MGGNVVIDGCAATPFLLAFRELEQANITQFMHCLNKASGYELFGPDAEALHSCNAYSGSSRLYMDDHYLDRDLEIKPRYGDLDVIVDPMHEVLLDRLLEPGKLYGIYTIVGYKKIASSFSAIVHDGCGDYYRQIDFEFKPYDPKTNEPTQFAQWSQSVSIYDLKAGIKGTFHKHLISACLYVEQHKGIVERHPRGKDPTYTPEMIRKYTFAQTHGIRLKYLPGSFHGVYREVKPHEVPYITDMHDICAIIFGTKDRYTTLDQFKSIGSFVGLIPQLCTHYAPMERDHIIRAFIYRVYDHKAMSPIDKDQETDQRLKAYAIRKLIKGLKHQLIEYDDFIEQRQEEYYAKF